MHLPFHKFESSDSIAFLDQRGDTGSSVSASTKGKPNNLSQENNHIQEEAPALMVAVSLRRGRLLLLTMIVVSVLVGMVVLLLSGVELTRFEASTKNITARHELLDDLNSYSGNVASAFSKPVEIVVTILVQLILLTFMAHAYTQPTLSTEQVVGRLVLSAGIGYLIGNGINAANVQLREMKVDAKIIASDLSIASNISASVASRTTSVINTVSEMTPGNLVTNTVLRNAVMPRVTFQQTICNWEQTRYETSMSSTPLLSVDYGFTLRDWQSRLLQEALPATTLKLTVNPTDKSVNDALKSEDLPMSAAIAGDLFLSSMLVGQNLFPWGSLDWDELPAWPTDMSEPERRDWFLGKVPALVVGQFKNSENASRRDINVSFSHVEISPTIDYDAVTVEFQIDPDLLKTATSRDKKTRYTQITQASEPGYLSDCGPWPALCLVKGPRFQKSTRSLTLDTPQQVHAISSCMSHRWPDMYGHRNRSQVCTDSSANNFFVVMSVGRRIEADAFEQNRKDNVTSTGGGSPALLTNLRKIYTFTLGRLSWRLENLADAFGAECGVNGCLGLQMPLAASPLSASGAATKETTKLDQRLVVSADALPTNLLVPVTLLSSYLPRSVPLVTVSDPPSEFLVRGDLVMPHSVGSLVWKNETVKTKCDSDFEGLIYTKVNNHMYIEHGLQTAYTAGMFFLLQNAVVKDTIVADEQAEIKTTTLNFDGNKQRVLAIVSTPMQNACLTFAGCAILLVSVLVAVAKTSLASPAKTNPMVGITSPHVIARVMMDDKQFPAMLLHRRVVEPQGDEAPARTLDQFTITQLAAVHEDEDADDVAKHLKTR